MRTLLTEYVVAATDLRSSIWKAGAEVEVEVFAASGYGDPEEIRREYVPYDEASTFVVAIEGGRAVGSVRLIQHSGRGFKTLVDIASGRLDAWADDLRWLDNVDTIEVGTMSLRNADLSLAHQGRVAAALYGGLIGFSRLVQAKRLLASWDEQLWQRYLRTFGPNAGIAIGPTKWYLGSPTLPAVSTVETGMTSLAEYRPSLYRSIEHNASRVQVVLDVETDLLAEQAYADDARSGAKQTVESHPHVL